MVDASLDVKKGENVILKQTSYRFDSCPDYKQNIQYMHNIVTNAVRLGELITIKTNAGVNLTPHEEAILWWLSLSEEEQVFLTQAHKQVLEVSGVVLTDNDIYEMWQRLVD